jgi:hypothetical protein
MLYVVGEREHATRADGRFRWLCGQPAAPVSATAVRAFLLGPHLLATHRGLKV